MLINALLKHNCCGSRRNPLRETNLCQETDLRRNEMLQTQPLVTDKLISRNRPKKKRNGFEQNKEMVEDWQPLGHPDQHLSTIRILSPGQSSRSTESFSFRHAGPERLAFQRPPLPAPPPWIRNNQIGIKSGLNASPPIISRCHLVFFYNIEKGSSGEWRGVEIPARFSWNHKPLTQLAHKKTHLALPLRTQTRFICRRWEPIILVSEHQSCDQLKNPDDFREIRSNLHT